MRFSTLLIPLFSLSLLFHGCSKESAEEGMVSTAEFTLSDTQGNSYKVQKKGTNFELEDAKDKVVLFDIFATWCPPCQAEVRHLGNLQKKYGEDLVIIGVTIEEDKSNEELEAFRAKYQGGNYRMVNKADNQLLARAIAPSRHPPCPPPRPQRRRGGPATPVRTVSP